MNILNKKYNTKFELIVYYYYLQLLILNRWFSAAHSGNVTLFGCRISYPKRGSLHGMFKEIFIKKNYDTKPTEEPIKIIDCGSNIGLSLLYFQTMAPNSQITAFEPNPHTFKILKENVEKNNWKIKLKNSGVAGNSGEVVFYTDVEDMSSQSASMTRHLDTKKRPLVPMKVNMVRLSDLVDGPVDILKLDIEGAEGEVLEDLYKENKISMISKIFIEYHFDGINTVYPFGKLLSILDQSGFKYAIETGVKFPYKIPKSLRNYSYKIIAWR